MKLPSLLAVAVLAVASSAFAQLAPLSPDGFVRLETIVNEFATNPDAATAKYNGKRIIVYGPVASLSQNGDSVKGHPLTVYLKLQNQAAADVKAEFSQAEIPAGYQDAQIQVDGDQASIFHRNRLGEVVRQRPFISVGENIAVHGTFDRFKVGDIVLKDCRKVAPRRVKELLSDNRGN